MKLEEQGIGLKSLQEAIDTTTSTGKLVFHIFGALAEFERNLIRERTLAGLSAARARGRLGGRKPSLNQKEQKRLKELYKQKQLQVNELCEMFKITKSSLYRFVKE